MTTTLDLLLEEGVVAGAGAVQILMAGAGVGAGAGAEADQILMVGAVGAVGSLVVEVEVVRAVGVGDEGAEGVREETLTKHAPGVGCSKGVGGMRARGADCGESRVVAAGVPTVHSRARTGVAARDEELPSAVVVVAVRLVEGRTSVEAVAGDGHHTPEGSHGLLLQLGLHESPPSADRKSKAVELGA
jgi:hypothetical protein